MAAQWGTLPLLPLSCVLDYLSTTDALAAMSTCRHWRGGMLLYEGRKDSLKLRVKQSEKNMLVTRLFKRHIKKLHIYVDCERDELDVFMDNILLQFLDTYKLQELVFIGPTYLHQTKLAPIVKLNRIVTENLMMKHAGCLHKLMLFGCELSSLCHHKDPYWNKVVGQYSRRLSFRLGLPPMPNDPNPFRPRSNIAIPHFTALNHLAIDCEMISEVNMNTLMHLKLSQLTLNVGLRRRRRLPSVSWPRSLRIAVHVVCADERRLQEVMERILVEGMSLVSLKVIFCKTLYPPLINHVTRLFKTTLQELVWVDAPYEPNPLEQMDVEEAAVAPYDATSVNPLILLCWQCNHLKRLALHGYWIWQYELVGLVRLRKTLQQLEVSAVYERSERFNGGMMRVMADDRPRALHHSYVQQINDYTGFPWELVPWSDLHPALRAGATSAQRTCYLLRENAVW